jgi:cyclic pyranopterin phosphate synthase
MPENGIIYENRDILLSYEEMIRLTTILAEMGVSKVRITGGEPFVRRNLIDFLYRVKAIPGIESLHITTNGVLTKKYLDELKTIGVSSINLSLDTLNKEKFKEITRRDEFDNVMQTYYAILEHEFKLKVNCVVIDQKNTEDIIPMVELTRDNPVNVRFIEEMPFNGDGNYKITKIPDPLYSTSSNYKIPGFAGDIGIIAAYSRTFCGTCDRIRVTAQGQLKTCLYDGGILSIRDLLRSTEDNEVIRTKLYEVIGSRSKDGFEAESKRSLDQPATESMSTIGG